jgi:hypothetical protein
MRMNEPEIDCPEWTPAIVCEMANYLAPLLVNAPAEVKVLLFRLLWDERMKPVWEEIGKRKRVRYVRSEKYFYSVHLPAETESWPNLARALRQEENKLRELGDRSGAERFTSLATDAEARATSAGSDTHPDFPPQELAKAVIFALVLGIFRAGLQTIRTSDFGALIARLRAEGKEQEAEAYLQQAQDPKNKQFLVDRQRTDARIEAFVKGLATETTKLFGSPLYGVLAILMNVAFEGAGYDQQRIRALLRE